MASGQGRSREVDDYVASLGPDQQPIVAALRSLIFEAAPNIEERLKSDHPSYSLDGHVCDIIAFEDHTILGFLKGVGLADPTNLLRGTGKRYREAQFAKLEDIGKDELMALIREAVELNVR